MSLKEKRLLAYIIGSITFFTLYCLIIYRLYTQFNPAPERLLTFWGAMILIMIPVQILPKLVIDIFFKSINRDAATFDKERERLIELKMLKSGYMFFVAGFLLAMVPLLMGRSVSIMFIILLLSMAGSCIFTDLSGLFFYRRAALSGKE